MTEKDDTCGICGRPILPGQAVYTREDVHYDCKYPSGPPPSLREIEDQMDAALDRAQRALNRLKR